MTNETEMTPNQIAMIQLCKRYVERERALNFKGKKADDAALNFIVGAMVGAELSGNAALAIKLQGLILLVLFRGALEIRKIASEFPNIEAQPTTGAAPAI